MSGRICWDCGGDSPPRIAMTAEPVHPNSAEAARRQLGLARDHVRVLAIAAGFAEAGLVALPHAAEARDASRFREWVGKGHAGTMHYLERKTNDGQLARERVTAPFPWARSAIVCFSSYLYPERPLSIETPGPLRPSESTSSARGTKIDSYHSAAPGGSEEDSPGWTRTLTLSEAKGKRMGESWEMSQQKPLSPVGATDSARDFPLSGWIARYAWSSRVDEKGNRRPSDYHKVLLKRLKALETSLHAQFGDFESRAYVDTGPVVERALAVAAGVGWIGKNTCLIHPKLGSWGFLAVLLTSLEVSEPVSQPAGESAVLKGHHLPGSPATGPRRGGLSRADKDARIAGALAPEACSFEIPDRCGSCRRCIEACPTHALDVPYQMNATRCIAYLTIEHKGPIAEELMPGIGRQVFGCDICQDVCPWNRKAPIVADSDLEPRPELINPALDWLSSLDEPSFEETFNGSPVRRTGFNSFRRNIAIAMGNSRLAQFIPQLEKWALATDEGLRSAAGWALGRLRNR
jgi:epoxyqueuosine reductase